MSHDTIVFLADPHLGEDKPGHQRSFEEVLSRVAPMKPKLVVVLGDVTQDGKVKPEYFGYARDQIARFDAEVICIPGNHENGYNAHRTAWPPPIEPAFIERFENHFNPMPWSRRVGRVHVLGIDSQLLGSDFPEERQQIDWLKQSLRDAQSQDETTIVVMHTPLFVATPGAADDPHDYWAIPHAARGALLDCLRRFPPHMLLAGHVHRDIEVPCDFCAMRTLASSSFQAHTIWSVENDLLPAGSDELCFYTMDAGVDHPQLQRHVLDHQDRHQ